MSYKKPYIRARGGFPHIKDTRNGFPVGYYYPEKRPVYYTTCGVIHCYWESGTFRLDYVVADLIEHYESVHLRADGQVVERLTDAAPLGE